MKKIAQKVVWLVFFPFYFMQFIWIEVGVLRGTRCPACRHRRKRIEGEIDPACHNPACSICRHRSGLTSYNMYIQ